MICRCGWAGLMLKRGSRVFEPWTGLKSRALTKVGTTTRSKSNDTTKHHPARPALNRS